MPPAAENLARKVSESPVITATVRVLGFLTPILVTIALFVLGQYLAGQQNAMAAMSDRILAREVFDVATDKRVTTLETQAQLGRADRLAFQDRTDEALRKVVDQQTQLLTAVASVVARLDAEDRAAARH